MHRMRIFGLWFALIAVLAAPSTAQSEKTKNAEPAAAASAVEPPRFYRLEFLLKEVEGAKLINGRTYSLLVSNERSAPPGSIRMGSRVPYPPSPGAATFQYFDIGFSIDCRSVRELENQLALNVTADISTVPVPAEPVPSAPPTLRQTKWSSNVTVPFRKPMVIFSSDDVTTKRTLQLELTATPVR